MSVIRERLYAHLVKLLRGFSVCATQQFLLSSSNSGGKAEYILSIWQKGNGYIAYCLFLSKRNLCKISFTDWQA